MTAPAYVKELAEQLKGKEISAPQDGPDLRWAHQIVARANRGERVRSATLHAAEQALAAAKRKAGTA